MKKQNNILIKTTSKYHDNRWVLASFFLWIFLLGFLSPLLIFSTTSAETMLILSILMLFSILLLIPINIYGLRKRCLEITEDGISWPYLHLSSLFKDLEGDFISWGDIRRVVVKKTSDVLMTRSGEEKDLSVATSIKKDETEGLIHSIKIYTRKKRYFLHSTDLEGSSIKILFKHIENHVDKDVIVKM